MSDIPSLWPNIGQIRINFVQKGPFFKFPWKTKPVIFFGLQRLGFLQKNQEIPTRSFRKKMLKTPHFWAFWAKKADLDHFWPKRGHFRIFGEKAKTSLFYSFFLIFQYKKSENSNARIFGKMGTYERTNGWKYERRWIQRSIDSVERPKIRQFRLTNLNKSGKNLIFMPF